MFLNCWAAASQATAAVQLQVSGWRSPRGRDDGETVPVVVEEMDGEMLLGF